MNKSFWKASLIRAIRTIAQTLVSTLPVGLVITPEMIENANWNILFAILAWVSTGLLSGVASILTSLATGLPEVEE